MNPNPDATVRTHPDPADSILLSLARAIAGEHASAGASWPKLDLSDPQQRQFGDYELLEELGRGGMGVVYRARQSSLDREVAIKFIADWFSDPSAVARFLAEARAAARLLHPNIVPVHEVGSVQGMHYFSMPLIQGRALASVLDAGPMTQAATITLLLKLCDAIDYAHRLGLLHLDLKPANVLLDARGEPLIADFGLARHMDAKGGVDAQEVSGTPSYMAPEQILIKQYRLTPATDIYSLGAILYRCLTGVSPHGEGQADDVLRRAVAGRIRPPRELAPKTPRDLDAICMKCLELQPSDRYASAAQLADDLRRARDGLPVSVRRPGMLERGQRWLRREPRLALAGAMVVLALLAGAVATTWQWRHAVAERNRAVIASEVGAHLFAFHGDDNDRAEDLIRWLRQRLPGDETRQTDALTDFATSIGAQGRNEMESFLITLIGTLGVDYRHRMIHALDAGTDPDRQLDAALLAWVDERDDGQPTQFASHLRAAIQAHPDDRRAWAVAAVFCPKGRCLFPDAARQLVRLDPDNAYPRILEALAAADPAEESRLLHEAAQRSRFDDYYSTIPGIFPQAIEAAHLPAPPLIARPARLLAPAEPPESSIAYVSTASIPYAAYSRLARLCGASVDVGDIADPQVRDDCLVVGERMLRSAAHGTLLSQMIGVAIVRNVAPGTPQAEEARQKRRTYEYVLAKTATLSPGQQLGYSTLRFMRDMGTVGELEAYRRRLAWFGMPDSPPGDWQPDDPTNLLSARERNQQLIAIERGARALVAQARYAEAIASYGPKEALLRKHFTKDNGEYWRVPVFLEALGKARLALGQYEDAQANLVEAFDTFRSFGPGYRDDARACAQSLIALHEALARIETDAGHQAAAAEWRLRIAGLDAQGAE